MLYCIGFGLLCLGIRGFFFCDIAQNNILIIDFKPNKIMKTTSTITNFNEMSSEALEKIIEGRKHDFEIHTNQGTIYAHKVAGGFIETSDHGETQFTSLSKEELIEYYASK